MHELLTTAVVPNSLVNEVLKILQGLCAMTPHRQLERRLIFEGPHAPPLVGIGAAIMQGRKRDNAALWKELHEQLLRQSYYITISYEVEEAHFGKISSNVEEDQSVEGLPGGGLNNLRGTLQFFDNPDPPAVRPVNSRLVVFIKDESHLPTVLDQLKYKFSSEYVQEAFCAYRENVIFSLSRDLQWPTLGEDGARRTSPASADALPPYEDFRPFDGENKWALTASVQVSDGNQPALMQRGLDQLAQVKQEFTGMLEFGTTPRRQLDTRVQAYSQSLRA